MDLDLLCVGLTTLDILGRPIDAIPSDESGRLIDAIEIVPAGTAGGTALVAARLGLKVGLISALGDDNPGRFIRMVLTQAGIDLGLTPTIAGKRTSATILPIDSAGRRPTFHALGASMMTEIGPEHFAALARARFVHYAGIGAPRLDHGAGESFLHAARNKNCIVTCDLISPSPKAAAELRRLLPYIAYFMPSWAEARVLTGEADVANAAQALKAWGARTCIIKCGAAGIVMATESDVVSVPAYDVPVTDTTSCGDAWCAGFIAARAQGWTDIESARFGSASAALVAQGLGTTGKLESFGTTQAFMHTAATRQQNTGSPC